MGQDHVVRALRNAIRLNRVTHAYLFSGTRGVGKTSIARIFAKCLNCVRGPTDQPCLTCDICQSIAVGQDVDVIEIDGASNNGVEAVRELRQNAGLRPSRARYKIYYIDEVHMLSTGAFNALLKTLEEPPEHVKFLFATTEPNKIPITVLSRCQRFDFASITPEEILTTLESICSREGIAAEPEALRAVARRASGSLRDAQSLLERLLSSGDPKLTVERVAGLLGTASDERVLDLLDSLAAHDAGRALKLLDVAAGTGVQPPEFLSGLLEFLRDVMVVAACGGSRAGTEVPLLAASPRQRDRLDALADRLTIDQVLAALQILDNARGRLRGSPHGRLIVEMALVKVARLENLQELGALIGRFNAFEAGLPAPMAAPVQEVPALKKKLVEPPPAATPHAPAPRPEPHLGPDPTPVARKSASTVGEPPLDLDTAHAVWPDLMKKVGVWIAMDLSRCQPTSVLAPNLLVIGGGTGYNGSIVEKCGAPEPKARIERELSKLLKRTVTIRFEPAAEQPSDTRGTTSSSNHEETSATGSDALIAGPVAGPRRHGELEGDPIVQKVVELFEARPVHLEVEEEPDHPA